jgi:hypothetical protein
MRLLRMTTGRWMVLTLAVAISLCGWRVWWTPVGSKKGYFCSVCRMGRGVSTFFGKTRSVCHATEFSDWYSAHIEPQHEHLWDPEANIVIYNLFGQVIYGGTGASRKIPISILTPSQHQRFLEHVANIKALKSLLASIINIKNQITENEAGEDGKGIVLVLAIVDLEKACYPGTWDDWWARYWEREKESWKRD